MVVQQSQLLTNVNVFMSKLYLLNKKSACNIFFYPKSQNHEKPILVIDLMGLVRVLCKEIVEMLCGGRFDIYRQDFENLLLKLEKFADFVFFEDGPIVSLKFETFVKRQNDKYARSLKIIDQVNDQLPLHEIAENTKDIPTITSHLKIIENLAKSFGKLIITSTKECDAELVKYANANPSVLAVLADDSDFLIFSGHWRYWSLNQINMDVLTTLEYDKRALRKFLCLNDEQMKILATLGGNDILQYDEVRSFHRDNRGHNCQQKFPWLAEFIKENMNMQINSLEMVEFIALSVVGDNRKETMDRISASLMQYNTVSC